MDTQKISIETPIEYLKNVGPARAEVFKKELYVYTIADLLQHYPFRYVDRTKFHTISEITTESTYIQLKARLIDKQIIGEKFKKRLVARVQDETGMIELVWFQGIKWIDKILGVGLEYVVFGKPTFFNHKPNIAHPDLELLSEAKKVIASTLQPIYSTTEKLKTFGLDAKGIMRLQQSILQNPGFLMDETLPKEIIEHYKMLGKTEAMKQIHFPADTRLLHRATARLKFEELFAIQLQILFTKSYKATKFKGIVLESLGEYFNTFYQEQLPFQLTNAQKRVLKEIRTDTLSGRQMNRLLQGDVGSGKTVVALMSMLMAIDNGYQACIMAPTEILANQHYNSIIELTKKSNLEIGLLTGSTPKKIRKIYHEKLLNGELNILIGTHALIEDVVQFKNLGMVIIDEQHRFGVHQRSKLWKKNTIPPHVLVMTATPIPRTLAMTLYGDLDVSVIDELPAGRKPILTTHRYESSRLRLLGFLKEEITKGRQIYMVYPLIEESEKLDYLNLIDGFDNISREFPLPQYKVSIVHGKMDAKGKDFEMQRFIRGETQILVATTVIEVGVNVPNASVMVIESAERFGLAQLHQLRGRVGRGAEQSYCILMTGNKLSSEAKTRIETMVKTSDGFEIAEIDMKLRGHGDIQGTQQSGIVDLHLADLSKDQKLLIEARNCVELILSEDPSLSLPKNEKLRLFFKSKSNMGITWDKIS